MKRFFVVNLLFMANICWGQWYYFNCTSYAREDWKSVLDYIDVTAAQDQVSIEGFEQAILRFNSKPKAGDVYFVQFYWGSKLTYLYVVELLPGSKIRVYELLRVKKKEAEW